MATYDYLPRQNGNLMVWLNQFKTELTAGATELGLIAGDVTAMGTEITTVVTAIQEQAAQAAARQAATAGKKQAMKTVIPKIRTLVRRIKSLPNYTEAIGQRLGIVAGPAVALGMPLAASVSPVLSTGQVRNGNVEIRFVKSGFTGAQIACRRGTEAEFVVLRNQIYSPLIDARPNLARGPETRQYQAWYLDGDALTGQASDILVVTVPE